jgi:hypothetical protein
MEKVSKKNDLSGKMKTALDKAVKKIIAEEKNRDGHLVTGDENGNIKKIPAKDL